jgi:hypothetical protein
MLVASPRWRIQAAVRGTRPALDPPMEPQSFRFHHLPMDAEVRVGNDRHRLPSLP